MQEKVAPIARFVEKASQLLDDMGKEHGWFVALVKAPKEGTSYAPLAADAYVRMLKFARAGGENRVWQHDRAFLRQLRHRYQGEESRRSQLVGTHYSARFGVYLHARCPCYLELKKKSDAEG